MKLDTLISKIYAPFVGGPGAVGLLLLRLVIGIAFVIHGLPKIQAPFSWGSGMGIPPLFQALAALAEFGGGVALIVGFATPVAALGIAVTMAVAFFKVMLPMGAPFIASKPGAMSYELVAVFFMAALMFLTVGPGTLSIDNALFGKLRRK